MAKAVLNTNTNVTIEGSSLSIFTFYVEGICNIIAFITNEVKTENGASFIENELGYSIGGCEGIYFSLNELGELIVRTNDYTTFYIDDDGSLIMVTWDPGEYSNLIGEFLIGISNLG